MAKYSIINFCPGGVLLVVQCDSEADLEKGFEQFSKLVGQECKYEDLYPHYLNNGTMYQVALGPDDDRDERIKKALDFAMCYGQIDGGHHKQWTIDQMVRALTGCPNVKEVRTDCNDIPYEHEYQGESDQYKEFVRQAKDGADGPNTYGYDTGITP